MPILLAILVVILAATIVMSQIGVVVGKVDKALLNASTTIEKFINFSSGNGWNTEDEVFFKTLKTEYQKSIDSPAFDTGIDIALLAATIHYNRGVDITIFDENDGSIRDENPLADEEALFSDFLDAEHMKNFYYIANDKLGSLTNFNIGERRLMGHMYDISLSVGYYDWSTAKEKWSIFFSYFFDSVEDSLIDNVISGVHDFKTIMSYNSSSENSDNYFEYKYRNIRYEREEIGKLLGAINFEPVDVKNTDKSLFKSFPAPNLRITYNADKYYDYLVNVYLPGTFFSKGEENPEIIERMAREIFQQRDTYYYLFDGISESSSAGNCRYNYGSDTSMAATVNGHTVDTNFIDNLIVELYPSYCKGKFSNCPDAIPIELPLKDYVIGVAYSEIGADKNDQLEWLKANMVAIQSYTLNKNKGTLKKDGNNYYIKMINNTYQQTYCSITEGCMERESNRKPPLSTENVLFLQSVYDQIKYTFLYSSGGDFVGSYRSDYSMCISAGISGLCLGQNDSRADAETGLSYQNILGKYYTQGVGLLDISSSLYKSSVYQCYSPGLVAGNHGAMLIRTEAPISSDVYYNQPYVSNSNRGQCVWYVKGRASEIIGTTVTDPDLQNKLLSVLQNARGNGNQWYNPTLQSVFGSSADYTMPKEGAIGVYDWTDARCRDYWGGTCKEKYGHVIMIEEVNEAAGTVTYTDGWTSTGSCPNSWDCIKFGYKTNYPISSLDDLGGSYIFIGYIYLLD